MADERGLSRRAFLLGGVAAAGAAGLAVERIAWTRILREVGLASSPDHSVPKNGAPVRTIRFESRAMGRTTRMTLSTPTHHAA